MHIQSIIPLSRTLKGLVASVALLAGASQASAALVFDSFSGGGNVTNRGAESSPGSQIVVTTATTVTSIAVLTDMSAASNLKFLIFDHATHALLFSTGSKAFADDGAGQTWKESDGFSFTLQAGMTYDIGAISDTAGQWAFDLASESMNGLTSIVGNPNFANFAAPTGGGHAGADAAVRLFDGGAVPEPSAALLGLAALGLTARRRRS